MKDFDTEKTSLDEIAGASQLLQIENAGPVTAYIVYGDANVTLGNDKFTVMHEGVALRSARVFNDRFEVKDLQSEGLEVDRVEIPDGEARDKFLRKWIKAAVNNKNKLSPLLLIPLAACGGSGSDVTVEPPTDGPVALADAAALVASSATAISFSDGVTGAVADFLSNGAASVDLASVLGDDSDVNLTITDATGTVTATDLSVIGGSTTSTVTVANADRKSVV